MIAACHRSQASIELAAPKGSGPICVLAPRFGPIGLIAIIPMRIVIIAAVTAPAVAIIAIAIIAIAIMPIADAAIGGAVHPIGT